MAVKVDITKTLEEQGLLECDHCSGYGSSLKDPIGVDKCTECNGTGAVPDPKKQGENDD